jgi:ubiquinone/menaquinone biosynthesis C-methylase UbiE
MIRTLPFNDHVAEYEEWFEKYDLVFQSEVEAIRGFLPKGRGLEVAAGTGRFSKALGVKEGIEPSPNMRALALEREIEVLSGEAEHLPYKDMNFDFVLMAFCISYFEDLQAAFAEAKRVLKKDGSLIVAFIDKNSMIGEYYEQRKPQSIFYKNANFYSTKRIVAELKKTGFKKFQFSQTLFNALDDIKEFQPARRGHDEGSFIVIKATT